MFGPMRRKSLVWLFVIAVAALVAHACGYAFGVANQATYFLQALHPAFLRHDWLVTSTAEYHSVFSIVGGLLFRIDDTGATAFGIVHFIFMVTLLCGVFLVVGCATTRAALSIFVLVVGWLAVNGEHSVAGSYLWSCLTRVLRRGSGGRAACSAGLFSYVSLEERVPERYPLRNIRELVRAVLVDMNKDFAALYADEGRPSIPPEQLLSPLLLQRCERNGRSVSAKPCQCGLGSFFGQVADGYTKSPRTEGKETKPQPGVVR
jgi:hypothetical protein